MSSKFFKDEKSLNFFKMIAPGTPLREGLENVLRAKTGALIVIGDSQKILDTVDGGFNIDCNFSPANLYELAKMDGAIILNYNVSKILYANTQLNPSPSITTDETGTRHRTAQRVAIETDEIVISISQRRNIITLYKGYDKYVLKDTTRILSNGNQAIQTLDKYRKTLDQNMINLTALEFEDLVTLEDVAKVIQRTEMVMKIANKVERAILELGEEGQLVSMQLDELIVNVKQDSKLVFKDYCKNLDMEYKDFKKLLMQLSSEELLNLTNIIKILGYSSLEEDIEKSIITRGFRILKKIPKLPYNVIENLIDYFDSFKDIMNATAEDLEEVEGIGNVRAQSILKGIERLKDQVFLDRHI
ncbi:MAG: DNA integrity scanning diadenylate cyclase DisA [Peptostreptococcaceae bacterium]|nr:DNA integrity scanning diadenylate cyclase DisA [Peptostreptococcaceae bacterium]